MKKTIALLLLLGLMMSAAACGALNADDPAPAEETEVPVEALMAASESDAAALAAIEPPASVTDASVVDEESFAQAQELVGEPVNALYEAIGEPTDSQYAVSCLEDGAEDGMLYYDGFYVWTLRTEQDEIVHAVYLEE